MSKIINVNELTDTELRELFNELCEENQRRESIRRHNLAVDLRKNLIDFVNACLHYEYEEFIDVEDNDGNTIYIDPFDNDILNAIINALPTE